MEALTGFRAVVTGGAGFIGSHVVERLAELEIPTLVVDDLSTGEMANLRACEDSEVYLDEIDIAAESQTLSSAFERWKPDIVYHLAAHTDVPTSVVLPMIDAKTNVLGTINVLEAARRCGAGVVFASSGGAIYGECEYPRSEVETVAPCSPYAVSKLAGEEYVRAWNRLYQTNHVVLRYANVYGPRQLASLEGGVVARFLESIVAGEKIVVYGDGFQTRDFVYVEDVARATVEAAWFRADLPALAPGTFNVGTGVETTINELVRELSTLTASSVEVDRAPERLGDLRRSVLSPLRLSDLLKRQMTPLSEGLARTIEWRIAQLPKAAA